MKEGRARGNRRLWMRGLGVVGALSVAGIGHALWVNRQQSPYAGGAWLAGDSHIHTIHSADGQYSIGEQVAHAAAHGLNFCVITDHGSKNHDKVALETAYPALVEARKKHPDMLVFQGLEWNIPAAEHGGVILPVSDDEARQVAEFEARFDGNNESRENTPADTEADAIAGIKNLQAMNPKPLFFAHHPARRGIDSPREMRAWAEAGPDVVRGFEAAPGHQAGTLAGIARGYYEKKPSDASFKGYPPDSYKTWGGYDWYVSAVGGVWDSLLGEGRPWYITTNSDAHGHYTDKRVTDGADFATKGYVTVTDRIAEKSDNADFHPGEYNKTWVYAPRREHGAVLDAMRAGNMFTVLGDLIDRCELYAQAGNRVAPMGGTLRLDRAGQEVTIHLRVRVPRRANFGGKLPVLHHVDIITGEIRGPVTDKDAMTNPNTKVAKTFAASEAKTEGEYLVFTYRIPDVRTSFFVRVRGTNTTVAAPQADTMTVNPWDDLWFYSNPVSVRLP